MKIDPPNNLGIFWQQHIDSWQESGLRQVAYCKKHQLQPHRFSYWKRKLSASKNSLVPATSGFIKLIPDNISPASNQDTHLSVRLSNNHIIEGIQGCNLHLAVQLIELLP